MDGVIFIDKPEGISSFDVIRILRKKLGVKKMGHAGTLDPFATGLLIVGIGKETKKLKDYIKLPKKYEASIILGIKTDTSDVTGKIIENSGDNDFSELEIKKAINSVLGKKKIRPPIFSAIKVKGKPLYKYAREKINPEFIPEKEMDVLYANLGKIEKENGKTIISVEFDVSSGTYIRSISEEIGKALNVPACVIKLRRTKIGDFSVLNSQKLEDKDVRLYNKIKK